MAEISNTAGLAGEALVKSHLHSLGIDTGIVGSRDADLVALIGGVWRTLQVKSSSDQRYFNTGGPMNGGVPQRRYSEYDVDAFAFVFIPDPYPYYMARAAITDSVALPAGAFTRAGRDMSFEELLRRWALISPIQLEAEPDRGSKIISYQMSLGLE